MDRSKVEAIRAVYLKNPIQGREPTRLRTFKTNRGYGPVYDFYNTLTVVQGCDMWIACEESYMDTIIVSVVQETSLFFAGDERSRVSNSYQTSALDRKALQQLLTSALEEVTKRLSLSSSSLGLGEPPGA